MDTLRNFVNDRNTNQDVKQFILETLDKNALSSLKNTGQAVGYKEAVEAIRNAFSQMDAEYLAKEKIFRKEEAL